MGNPLFDELYRTSYRRDHARIFRIIAIHKQYPEADWLTCARLCDQMIPLERYFENEILEIAYRNRMRVRQGRYVCPKCDDPNCPDAVFVPHGYVLATKADLQKHLGGT